MRAAAASPNGSVWRGSARRWLSLMDRAGDPVPIPDTDASFWRVSAARSAASLDALSVAGTASDFGGLVNSDVGSGRERKLAFQISSGDGKSTPFPLDIGAFWPAPWDCSSRAALIDSGSEILGPPVAGEVNGLVNVEEELSKTADGGCGSPCNLKGEGPDDPPTISSGKLPPQKSLGGVSASRSVAFPLRLARLESNPGA